MLICAVLVVQPRSCCSPGAGAGSSRSPGAAAGLCRSLGAVAGSCCSPGVDVGCAVLGTVARHRVACRNGLCWKRYRTMLSVDELLQSRRGGI